MTGKRRYCLVLLVGLVWGGPVLAKDLDLSPCVFPAAPEVPDGDSADVEQLAAAGAAVRAFVAAMENQLTCLESLRSDLGEEITTDQGALITSAYNAGVDQINATADAYNTAVRAYEARAD